MPMSVYLAPMFWIELELPERVHYGRSVLTTRYERSAALNYYLVMHGVVRSGPLGRDLLGAWHVSAGVGVTGAVGPCQS